jgi:hypothetical protein
MRPGVRRGRWHVAVLLVAWLGVSGFSAEQPGAVCFAQAGPAGGSKKSDRKELPWADRAPTGDDGLPSDRAARRLLVGLEDSQLELLRDNEAVGAGEQETLERIVYRLSRLSPATFEQYRSPTASLVELADDPSAHRFQIMQVRGRLRRLEAIAVPSEMQQRLEFDRYWRATIMVEGQESHAIELYARDIPEGWRPSVDADDAVGIDAMFLKRGVEVGGRRQLVFVAQRVGWLPDRVDTARGITADLVRLAGAGFDVSLFDRVRTANGLAIGKSEREPFYQMLAAVNRLRESEDRPPLAAANVAPDPALQFDIAALLQKPRQQHGRRMQIRGTARAVKRVLVDDEELQARFGMKQYFEVDILVSLGDQTVRLGKDGPILANSFPVTCCVLEIPAEWQEKLAASGVYRLRESAVVEGYFYKLWGYRSEGTEQYARESKSATTAPLQVSPMFMASRAVRESGTSVKPESGTFLGTLWLVAMALVGLVVWGFYRSDARRRRTPSPDAVDFSGLSEIRPAEPNVSPPTPSASRNPPRADTQSSD